MSERQWAGTTFGNRWMHRSLVWILRHINTRIIYLFSDIFIVPVCLVMNPSRKTAYSFFRNRIGYGPLKSAIATYRNHCRFSEVVIDRFAMYAGKIFDVEVDGLELFNEYASGSDGFLMLSSHIGNYEIAGYSLVSGRKTINAVVYDGEKASVTENRGNMFAKTNIRMIAIKSDMSHLYEINNALGNGEIVSFPADRCAGDGRMVERVFMGQKAGFPQGPFSVALMRGLNVLAVNVMKESSRKYRIYVTSLQYDKSLTRMEQLEMLSGAYVCELERRVRQYPEQWYNFYDFWA